MSEMKELQIELVETQSWLIDQGHKVVIVLEGRDTAGKDGVIKRLTEFAHPRHTRVVALPKPNDRELHLWYFQRYIRHLPGAGELAIFNRSWYNRAGVEPVMGFCTPQDTKDFFRDTRRFEHMLQDAGTKLIKIWLDITKEEQARRLADRVHDPLKRFKLSSLDMEAQARWDDYTIARDKMLSKTHSKFAPWTAIVTDDKQAARVQVMRHILCAINRPGHSVLPTDEQIVLTDGKFKGKLAV